MNMRYQPKKNRRLLLTLAFLLLDIHSEHTSSNSHLYDIQKEPHLEASTVGTGSIVWLMDKDSGTCLGDQGFSECSDVNLWKSHSVSSDTVLQFESLVSHDANEESASSCLGRRVNEGVPSAVESQSCQQNLFKHGYTNWKYDSDTGRISSHSWFETPHCLFRDNDLNTVLILPCEEGYTSFYPIHFDGPHGESSASSSSSSSGGSVNELSQTLEERTSASASVVPDADPNTWTCPSTKLVLPRIIERSDLAPLTVVAGDVYLKTVMGINFRVYSVAWYVDVPKVYADPVFAPFLGKPATALAESEAFYEAMVHPSASYDRAVAIKLNMGLNMDDVIAGLVDELGLLPANAVAFAQVLNEYKKRSPKCEKGLEIVFRWRAADAEKRTTDFLEISIRGQVQAELRQPGIARDFFVKFVNDFPVSPLAKAQFPLGFATLLSHPPAAATGHSAATATAAAKKPRESKRARLKKFFMGLTQSPREKLRALAEKIKSVTGRSLPAQGSSSASSSPAPGATHFGRRKSFREFLKSVLIRRWNSPVFEAIVTAFILLNVVILIMMSLPARSFVRHQTARARSIIRNARQRLFNSFCSLKRAHSADSFRRPKRAQTPPTALRMAREISLVTPIGTCIRKSVSHSCLVAMKNI